MWSRLLEILGEKFWDLPSWFLKPRDTSDFGEIYEVGRNWDSVKRERFRFRLSDYCILILSWSLLLGLLVHEYKDLELTKWGICGFGICTILFSTLGFAMGLGACSRKKLIEPIQRTLTVGAWTAIGSLLGGFVAMVIFIQ